MNTVTQTRITKVALLGAALVLLAGCGSTITSKGSSTSGTGLDLSSRTPVPTGSTSSYCNMFDSSSFTLSGRVTSYVDYNNQVQEDKSRIRITNMSAKLDQTSTVYIKMFRWKAEGTDPVQLDSNPVTFTIESAGSVGIALSDPLTSLSSAGIAKIRSDKGVSGTTMMDFFNNTVIAVQGVDYNWDALKLVVYDGSTVLGQVDFLLPVFAANPNVYANDHAPALQKLHPLWSDRALTLTESQWQARTQNFCF
jgi:hypothetical protein